MLTQKQGSLYDAFEDVAEQYGQQGVDEMVHLSDMLHGLVEEMRAVMGRLLLVEGDDFGLVPRVEWTKIEDDHSEDRIGYSFLHDDRNQWVAAGDGWVLKQIFRSEERQESCWCGIYGWCCHFGSKCRGLSRERMRRIMQGHSGRCLGVRIGISPSSSNSPAPFSSSWNAWFR
ncbi:hypothetical protein V8F06_014835 [Rhypophila decipiens]